MPLIRRKSHLEDKRIYSSYPPHIPRRYVHNCTDQNSVIVAKEQLEPIEY